MAIGFDAVSESHTGTTGSTSESSFNWSHAPAGTPKGVLVFTFVNANADDATSVTYGGVSLTAVSGGRAASSNATSPGDCKAWFLGSGIPTGTQTVTVNRTNNANAIYAVAITVTSGTNSAVHTAGIVLLTTDASSISEQLVTDGSPGTNSLRFAGINCGFANWNEDPDGFPVPEQNVLPGSNSTWINNTTILTGSSGVVGIIDYGTRGCGVVKESAAGQGSRNVGFSGTTTAFPPPSLARAGVHLAIKEDAGSPTTAIKDIIGCGIIPFAR